MYLIKFITRFLYFCALKSSHIKVKKIRDTQSQRPRGIFIPRSSGFLSKSHSLERNLMNLQARQQMFFKGK
jgi:hypothetical protein